MTPTHEYKLLRSNSEPQKSDSELARETALGWKPVLMSAANDSRGTTMLYFVLERPLAK
jgi:hypothetical protein